MFVARVGTGLDIRENVQVSSMGHKRHGSFFNGVGHLCADTAWVPQDHNGRHHCPPFHDKMCIIRQRDARATWGLELNMTHPYVETNRSSSS